jgi:hypothetical protein
VCWCDLAGAFDAAKVQALKKAIPKGDKKRKKEVGACVREEIYGG